MLVRSGKEVVSPRMSSLLYLAVALIAAILPQGSAFQMDDDCLECICQAASNCNPNFDHQKDVYGLYKITSVYWSDAGRPTLNNESPDSNCAFRRCAKSPRCAGQTVLNYMKRFATKDCNRDGIVDCQDAALIHYLGPDGCRHEGKVDAAYWSRFNGCLHRDKTNEAKDLLDLRK